MTIQPNGMSVDSDPDNSNCQELEELWKKLEEKARHKAYWLLLPEGMGQHENETWWILHHAHVRVVIDRLPEDLGALAMVRALVDTGLRPTRLASPVNNTWLVCVYKWADCRLQLEEHLALELLVAMVRDLQIQLHLSISMACDDEFHTRHGEIEGPKEEAWPKIPEIPADRKLQRILSSILWKMFIYPACKVRSQRNPITVFQPGGNECFASRNYHHQFHLGPYRFIGSQDVSTVAKQ